jgi:hypothetical protein
MLVQELFAGLNYFAPTLHCPLNQPFGDFVASCLRFILKILKIVIYFTMKHRRLSQKLCETLRLLSEPPCNILLHREYTE